MSWQGKLGRSLVGSLLVAGVVGAGDLTVTSGTASAAGTGFDVLISGDTMAAGDGFGTSVAVSGDIMVVGAPGVTPDSAPSGSAHQGAAYVLQRPPGGTWGQAARVAELTASADAFGNSDASFGNSVAIDGTTIVVGAPATVNGQSEGAAYVFTEPSTGWMDATETAMLSASDGTANLALGESVSVSGGTVVAGAPGATVNGQDNQGAAYVFTEPSTGWTSETEAAKLTASDGSAGDLLGWSVGVSGTNIVVGAPYRSNRLGAVYVFAQGSAWASENATAVLSASDGDPNVNPQFGVSVAIDGNTVVAGAPYATAGGYSAGGEAYVFAAPGSTFTSGTETARLVATDPAGAAFFGTSVAVHGSTAAVGAIGPLFGSAPSGAVYSFDTATGNQVQKYDAAGDLRSNPLGENVAVSDDTVASGAPNAPFGPLQAAGAVLAFDLGPPPPPTPPVNDQPPAIRCDWTSCPSGSSLRLDEPVTADPGQWSSMSSLTYTYQWQYQGGGAAKRGWISIPGATSGSYTVPYTEQKKPVSALRVVVTATDSYGQSTDAASGGYASPTAPDPLVGSVSVACGSTDPCGQIHDGQPVAIDYTFTDATYGWPVVDGDHSFSWGSCNQTSCGQYQAGRSSTTFSVPVPPGTTQGAVVGYTQAQVELSFPLLAGFQQPTTELSPIIPILSGPVAVNDGQLVCQAPNNPYQCPAGKKIAIDNTKQHPLFASQLPLTYTYQWAIDTGSGFVDVPGATSPTFASTAIFSTMPIIPVEARVTGTDSLGGSATALVSRQCLQLCLPQTFLSTSLFAAQPVIGGTPKVGKKLSVAAVTKGLKKIGFAYQWEDCPPAQPCTPVAGGVLGQAATYQVTASDLGVPIQVMVTATDEVGNQQQVQSVATAPVVPEINVVNLSEIAGTLLPRISNVAVGATATADPGTWQPKSAELTFSYQWWRCPTSMRQVDPRTCVTVPGATDQAYTLGVADEGYTVGYAITATDIHGEAFTAYSSLTSPVS